MRNYWYATDLVVFVNAICRVLQALEGRLAFAVDRFGAAFEQTA